MKNLAEKFNQKKAVASVAVFTAVLAIASPSFAQATQTETDVTGLLDDGLEAVRPIILAIAAGVVGFAVLRWGVRAALRVIGSGGRSAG